MRASPAEEHLRSLFRDGEWATERTWLRSRHDRNSFMTANILLILEHAAPASPALATLIDLAKQRLLSYREGHQAWHWPVRAGRSAMANAPPLWRHRWVEISPDADCTCLVQLARRDAGLDDGIVDDLAFYRADGARFRLPAFQRGLPAVENSFLTWFPPRVRCRPGTVETVDAGVDANILWYLAECGRLDTAGAAETTAFLGEVIRQSLVLRAPFRVSPYYPRPAALLYLISRAAVWGNLPDLLALRGQMLRQLSRCTASTTLDILCREAALRLWDAPPQRDDLPTPTGSGAFYVGPLLAWPLQRFAPLESLAAQPLTHIKFRCEALEWALHWWLDQTPRIDISREPS